MWSDWLLFCDYGFSVSALWCPSATPTVFLGFSHLGYGVSLHGCSSKAQPLLLTLHPSWPWVWSSSSQPSWAHAAAALWMWDSSSRLLLCHRSLALSVAAPDLGRGVAPLGCGPSQLPHFCTFCHMYLFSSVQSLSHVWLFATPWIAARQASLSITNSQSSLKLTSVESVMLSSHLILCRPFLLLPQFLPASEFFQWVNSSHEVAKVLEFQL